MKSATVLMVIAGIMACTATAVAQTTGRASEPRWEIEVHGSGTFANLPADGTPGTLPGGQSMADLGITSRKVSSWYFGGGAQLLDHALGYWGSDAHAVPLDPMFQRSPATRGRAWAFGARASYAMTPRFSAEFSYDVSESPTQFTDAFVAGVEASRASFISAWNAIDEAGYGSYMTGSPVVTSTSAVRNNIGRQMYAIGALNIGFLDQGRARPYVTIGAGAVHYGDLPSLTLRGQYQFPAMNLLAPAYAQFPVNETDTVNLRMTARDTFVTVLGAGIKTGGRSRFGVRADVRVHLSKNTTRLLLDASPVVATGTPSGLSAFFGEPTLVFSNNPSIGYSSSLSGDEIKGLEVFKGRGTEVHTTVTAGVVVRF